MKILHLSDTHYGQPGAVERCQPTIDAMMARPDICDCIVVHTGDLIDSPAPGDQYDEAVEQLRPLADACLAYFCVPGNHDLEVAGLTPWAKARSMYDECAKALGSIGQLPYMRTIGYTAIIGLDTNRRPPGAIDQLAAHATATGHIGKPQISAISHQVLRQKSMGRRVVVLAHHSPMGGHAALRLSDRGALGEALDSVGGVDLMLVGHLHEAGKWKNEYGADVVLSAPKCGDPGGYWEVLHSGVEWVEA